MKTLWILGFAPKTRIRTRALQLLPRRLLAARNASLDREIPPTAVGSFDLGHPGFVVPAYFGWEGVSYLGLYRYYFGRVVRHFHRVPRSASAFECFSE